jgi:MTH538 TIR-like domain (DUF1863)
MKTARVYFVSRLRCRNARRMWRRPSPVRAPMPAYSNPLIDRVLLSFHFDNDVMRVQQIRNIGSLDDNKPVAPNEWESVRRTGDAAIERWIDRNMNYRDCVVVLIGSETASRKWVLHERSNPFDRVFLARTAEPLSNPHRARSRYRYSWVAGEQVEG